MLLNTKDQNYVKQNRGLFTIYRRVMSDLDQKRVLFHGIGGIFYLVSSLSFTKSEQF